MKSQQIAQDVLHQLHQHCTASLLIGESPVKPHAHDRKVAYLRGIVHGQVRPRIPAEFPGGAVTTIVTEDLDKPGTWYLDILLDRA